MRLGYDPQTNQWVSIYTSPAVYPHDWFGGIAAVASQRRSND